MLNRRALLQGLVGAGAVGGVADWRDSRSASGGDAGETSILTLYAEIGIGGFVHSLKYRIPKFPREDAMALAGRGCKTDLAIGMSFVAFASHVGENSLGQHETILMLTHIDSAIPRCDPTTPPRQMALAIAARAIRFGMLRVDDADHWKRYKDLDMFPREVPTLRVSWLDQEFPWSETGTRVFADCDGFGLDPLDNCIVNRNMNIVPGPVA